MDIDLTQYRLRECFGNKTLAKVINADLPSIENRAAHAGDHMRDSTGEFGMYRPKRPMFPFFLGNLIQWPQQPIEGSVTDESQLKAKAEMDESNERKLKNLQILEEYFAVLGVTPEMIEDCDNGQESVCWKLKGVPEVVIKMGVTHRESDLLVKFGVADIETHVDSHDRVSDFILGPINRRLFRAHSAPGQNIFFNVSFIPTLDIGFEDFGQEGLFDWELRKDIVACLRYEVIDMHDDKFANFRGHSFDPKMMLVSDIGAFSKVDPRDIVREGPAPKPFVYDELKARGQKLQEHVIAAHGVGPDAVASILAKSQKAVGITRK